MVAKPIYGLLSDSLYIAQQHRIPYIAIGAFLQAVSWIAIACLSPPNISFFMVTVYLLLGNLGASIGEVAETGKQPSALSKKSQSSSSSGELQSFVWMACSIGGVLGNLLGGFAIDRFTSQAMFFLFGIILAIQPFITISTRESSLNLAKSPSNVGFRKQLSELLVALRKPEIAHSMTWFVASYAIIPALTGTMFFYQTQYLEIDSSVLGFSKVFGQIAMLLWGVIYNRHLKSVPPKKIISAIQLIMAVFMVLDVLFVKGIYRRMGIPASFYVVVFSGLLEVLYFFKILQFNILVAQLCPPGCEGSVMAFLTSSIALAFIVSGYLAFLYRRRAHLLPLYWSSCIPDYYKPVWYFYIALWSSGFSIWSPGYNSNIWELCLWAISFWGSTWGKYITLTFFFFTPLPHLLMANQPPPTTDQSSRATYALVRSIFGPLLITRSMTHSDHCQSSSDAKTINWLIIYLMRLPALDRPMPRR